MNAEERTKRIKSITESGKYKNIVNIFWQGSQQQMESYMIPLEYVVYNKYNDRIASWTASLEKQGKSLDPETQKGKQEIEKLLWLSDEPANKKTLEDLRKKTQSDAGIVTKDGIIIDGNRRAMLLNRLNGTHFNAVVLPVALETNKKEILRLETSYQIGADEKVGYGTIEKYLKINNLFANGFDIKAIADMTGYTIAQIEDSQKIFDVMQRYLKHFGYEGIYRQLDKREGQFVDLSAWLEKYNEAESASAFDGYDKNDVADLQMIAFDYIRAKWEGKDFRNIAQGNKGSHFFSDTDLWRKFVDEHFQEVQPLSEKADDEMPIDYEAEDLFRHLEARDKEWEKQVYPPLKKNLEIRKNELDDLKNIKKPKELLSKALSSLSRIDYEEAEFSGEDIKELVDNINNITYRMKKALKHRAQ